MNTYGRQDVATYVIARCESGVQRNAISMTITFISWIEAGISFQPHHFWQVLGRIWASRSSQFSHIISHIILSKTVFSPAHTSWSSVLHITLPWQNAKMSLHITIHKLIPNIPQKPLRLGKRLRKTLQTYVGLSYYSILSKSFISDSGLTLLPQSSKWTGEIRNRWRR